MINILQGNCLDKLKELPDQSINTCITSPPYWGLRNYGDDKQLGLEDTPEEYVDNLVKVFKEVKRVLRNDGTVWLNLGDCFLSNKQLGLIPFKVAIALQQDNWILRQDIIWHKPNPMPESVRDRCTKAHEYIFLLSKSTKYYFDNEAIKEDSVTSTKQQIKKRNKFYRKNAKGTEEKYLKQNFANDKYKDKVFQKRNKRSVWTITTKPFKRAHFATFPMDLIEPCVLAGCPEKVCIDCGTPYQRITSRKSDPLKVNDSTLDRYGNGKAGVHRKIGGQYYKWLSENPLITVGWEKQCSCETNETKSGTVLDHFAGSGTTGIVANNHNRNAVLIELNAEYIEIARERIEEQGNLFCDYEIEWSENGL